MINQPYILKKQIISLAFFSLIFLILKCVYNNSSLITPVFYYCIEIIFITFVPSLRKNLKYPMFLHSMLYYSALFLPALVINIDLNNSHNFTGVIIGIMVNNISCESH